MRVGKNVATSSIVISACGLVGQAAAFATTFLLAKLFGAKADMDAFAATIAVPYFVTALVSDPDQQQALVEAIKKHPELLFKAAEHAHGKPRQMLEQEFPSPIEIRWKGEEND